jgi:hypothetical protein
LTIAVTSLVDRSRRRRRIAAAGLALLLGVGCRDDGGASGPEVEDDGPNTAPPQTLAGGVDLPPVDPRRMLVGEGLAYGTPLPSQQLAADAFLDDPEVAAAVFRPLFSRLTGRALGEVFLLELDGDEVFDQEVLDAFVEGTVVALGGAPVEPVTIAGQTVLRSHGPEATVLGRREGNQLLLVRSASADDAQVVVERQLRAFAAGALAEAAPFTPLVSQPIDAAFVNVPTLSFQPIPPPEDEPAPEPPTLVGATAVHGRYGVTAGERRTTAWAYTLDPATYRSAEQLMPALEALVSARAGGAPVETTEVLDRFVLRADGPEGSPSVRAFRHHGLAVVIEGLVPAQVDAAVSAWLAEL